MIPGVDRPLDEAEARAFANDWTARRETAVERGISSRQFFRENPALEKREDGYYLPEIERQRLLRRAGR